MAAAHSDLPDGVWPRPDRHGGGQRRWRGLHLHAGRWSIRPALALVARSTFAQAQPMVCYRPPAPEAWQTEIKTGYGEVESKGRFPLPHTPDGGEILTKLVALN